MKILHTNSLACSYVALVFCLVSCGDSLTSENHSDSAKGNNSQTAKAQKTQESLLALLEGTDSPQGETSVQAPISDLNGTVLSKGDTAPSITDAMEALLSEDAPVEGEPALGAKSRDHSQMTNTTTAATQTEAKKSSKPNPDQDLQELLTKLSNSKLAFEEQINKLKKMVGQRDGTINSLKLINQQLREELTRIRKTSSGETSSLPVNGEIQVLRDEILKLKNTFTLKVKELDELRNYNKQLVNRLDYLGPVAERELVDPLPSDVSTGRRSTIIETPENRLNGLKLDRPVISPSKSSEKALTAPRPTTGSLDFDAVVTAANGKIKEAFYTEFFIVKSDLREILENAGITLENAKYKDIENHAELWAQSRKYPFRYPDLQKKIRKALLDSISDEKSSGRRIRTDIDGNSGAIRDLAAGSYYIIGTASLGQVGVTWSLPVKIETGRNKVSLTIANASWSL
jgi:hypothetical protein